MVRMDCLDRRRDFLLPKRGKWEIGAFTIDNQVRRQLKIDFSFFRHQKPEVKHVWFFSSSPLLFLFLLFFFAYLIVFWEWIGGVDWQLVGEWEKMGRIFIIRWSTSRKRYETGSWTTHTHTKEKKILSSVVAGRIPPNRTVKTLKILYIFPTG